MAQLGNGVTIAELASMLNASQDPKAICTSDLINKWSKHKPIHYSETGPLLDLNTGDDHKFKGMSTEFSQGIIYGLKAGVQNASPANIHAANWDYVSRPQGGIPNSPYRVDDFWGYEKDIQNPSLYGGGLANGQEGIYTNNVNITTQVTWDDRPGIVNVGDVFAWGNNAPIDPSNMYLCVLVGNYARAMLAKDAGDIVAPLYYNNVQNKTFAFPEMTSLFTTIGLPLETELDVTVFIVHKNDINQFKDAWYDMSLTPNLTNKPVTLPMQVGLKMKFRAPGLIYIRNLALAVVTEKGVDNLKATWTEGPDWNRGYMYRILYNISDASGSIGSFPSVDIPVIDWDGSVPTAQLYILREIISGAGFVLDGITTRNYTISADFQAKSSSDSDWKTTGEIKTIQVQCK